MLSSAWPTSDPHRSAKTEAGSLPLHVAASGAPLDMVQYLAEQQPQFLKGKGGEGELPAARWRPTRLPEGDRVPPEALGSGPPAAQPARLAPTSRGGQVPVCHGGPAIKLLANVVIKRDFTFQLIDCGLRKLVNDKVTTRGTYVPRTSNGEVRGRLRHLLLRGGAA